MQILFYQTSHIANEIEQLLTPYFYRQGISVSYHSLCEETFERHLESLHTGETVLIFYRFSTTPSLSKINVRFPKHRLRIKRIALCQTYDEGIMALENGSDYALSLPLHPDKLLRCCGFLTQKTAIGKTDIINRTQSHLSLFESCKPLMDKMQLGISRHSLDENLTLLDANVCFYELTVFSPDEYENLIKELKIVFQSGAKSYETLLLFPQKEGSCIWLQVKATFFGTTESGFPQFFLIFNNVNEQIVRQQQDQELIMKLSFSDPLTGGYNYTRFETEMIPLIQKNPPKSYSLVSLDIQHFKLINEQFGLKYGDRALRYIHNQFSLSLQENELITRVSSDNFVLLLHLTDIPQIQKRLADCIKHLNRFNQYISRKYFFSFYAGICIVDDPLIPMQTLLDRANIARKKACKNQSFQLLSCAVFQEEDRMRLLQKKELENRMETALSNREFVVYLQPKFSLKSNQIEGAEALVRWNSPEHGLILPGNFIPLFEKNGFITKLDLYVFEEVCKYIRKWLDNHLKPVVISINLSRAHITDPNFLEEYEAVRTRYEIPVHFLEFEMTETMILENSDTLKKVIHRMHKLGYQCSMDDFGSGYSSLHILKEMDFDVMKLDRAFFQTKTCGNPKEQEIISTVISLADKLQMASVAEGVETTQQLEFLKTTTCNYIQGYVFSHPLPVDDFELLKYGKILQPS